MAFYCEDHVKHMNTLFGKNAEFCNVFRLSDTQCFVCVCCADFFFHVHEAVLHLSLVCSDMLILCCSFSGLDAVMLGSPYQYTRLE